MKTLRTHLVAAAIAAAAAAISTGTASANVTGTFDFALIGYPGVGTGSLNVAGPFRLTPNTTRVFEGAALDGSDVTVWSLVKPLGANRYEAKFRMETEDGHEFLPAGTRLGTRRITDLSIDLGAYDYPGDALDFAGPVAREGYSDYFNIDFYGVRDLNNWIFTEDFLPGRTALEGFGDMHAGYGFDGVEVTINYTIVPEPGTAVLALAGLAGLAARRPRRRR